MLAQIPRHLAQPQTSLFSSNVCTLAVGIKRKLRLWGWAGWGAYPGEENGNRVAEQSEDHLPRYPAFEVLGKGENSVFSLNYIEKEPE